MLQNQNNKYFGIFWESNLTHNVPSVSIHIQGPILSQLSKLSVTSPLVKPNLETVEFCKLQHQMHLHPANIYHFLHLPN